MSHWSPGGVPDTATQVTYPRRTLLRTLLQVAFGVLAAAPLLVADLGVDETLPIVAVILGVSAAITRVMATPGVDFMLGYVHLGADPDAPTGRPE